MDSYFEKGVHLHGTIWFKDSVHFDGYFEGEIFSSKDFVIGKSGKVLGNIKTFNITNKGNIQGNLYAENKVCLIDGSRLTGDIATYRLTIDEGSSFDGRCKMIDVPPKKINEEIKNLERPLPSKTKNKSKFFKTGLIQGVWNYSIVKMGIFTVILVIVGIII
tara:strand:- start:154 stop:639 length:486 start_codon:yes stop_codon:yes gene_type:complete